MEPITITVRSGQQVEGLELNETLRQNLFGQASDDSAVAQMLSLVRTILAVAVSIQEPMDIAAAAAHVQYNSRPIQ